MRLQIIDINDRDLFALCELRLYLPLDVQRKHYEWIKLATTNFQEFGPKLRKITRLARIFCYGNTLYIENLIGDVCVVHCIRRMPPMACSGFESRRGLLFFYLFNFVLIIIIYLH